MWDKGLAYLSKINYGSIRCRTRLVVRLFKVLIFICHRAKISVFKRAFVPKCRESSLYLKRKLGEGHKQNNPAYPSQKPGLWHWDQAGKRFCPVPLCRLALPELRTMIKATQPGQLWNLNPSPSCVSVVARNTKMLRSSRSLLAGRHIKSLLSLESFMRTRHSPRSVTSVSAVPLNHLRVN